MTSPSQVGFQPRTTPGERRADIDLRRKIAAINANLPDLSDYYTKSEADAQFLTESEADTRYVNTAGDTMTGRLLVGGGPSGNHVRLLSNGAQGYLDGMKADGATRVGYLLFHEDGSVRLTSDAAAVQLRSATEVNSNAPVVLPGNPTTALQATPKQYVDARTDASRFTSAGVALSGTYAGEATVNTLNFTLPVASYIHFTGILFVSKTVAGDRHLVNCYLDGSGTAFNQIALLGLTQTTAHFSYSASLAAGAHTILVRMIRDAGTGNAQVFADSRSNRTDLLAVPS
ncbi:MAG TPA: hypothetical protein VFX15_00290 [Actinomycetes bacterium]|nr:hypothetical protein [Actinomycetes bacterium]